MFSHNDNSKGKTPEELLCWLRDSTGSPVLDDDSNILFSEFMYQAPYWERSGYWDVQRYYERHSGKPTPISAFSDFISATVREVIGHHYNHLLSVAFEVTSSSEIHGFHALDQRSGAHAIVLGAQLIMGLPRANMNFLHVVNSHQLGSWTGRYDAQASQLRIFLGLQGAPDVGQRSTGGMFLPGDEETAHSGRLVAKLARELFSEPKDMVPWMIEAEGIDWLTATAFAQQLFIVLHEYGHAQDCWAVGGKPVAHGLLLRCLSGQSEDIAAEDRADVWAAELLQTAVRSGRIRLDNWDHDVRGFLERERWPLPSDPLDLLAFALFLFFEYLHVAQRLGWLEKSEGYRPPRERYDLVASRLGSAGISRSFHSDMRQLLETLSTVASFDGHGRDRHA